MIQKPALTIEEWKAIAAQTTICRAELQTLLALVNGHIRSKELAGLMRINKTLTLIRYRLEVEMFNQTDTQDTGIFDPEVWG